ncbi:MAG TPA: protein kinase [Ktedonobacterales bacterium]|jgi:serine/threonine-protein kinase
MSYQPLNPGALLQGRYLIEDLLGEGGFGAVYRARDLHLARRLCAVKETFDTSSAAAVQFRLEAEILAGLEHPYLPEVWDYFEEERGLYLVMEFIEGEDLETQLNRDGPLPELLVRQWISQLCGALALMHARQPPVIHRDIKPANIKIRTNGQPVLVDFGLAKVYHPTQETVLAARAVSDGFSPIEQYGRGRTDARSDMYALGATLYNLLTGVVPPDAPARAVNDPLVPPQQVNPAISPGMDRIILRSLSMHTEARYQSALDLQRELERGHAAAGPYFRGPTCPSCAAPRKVGLGFCDCCGATLPVPGMTGPIHATPTRPIFASAPPARRQHTWEVIPSPTTHTLYALGGTAAEGLAACGANGTILVNVTGNWVALASPTADTLHAIALRGQNIWAAGAQGAILHYGLGRWNSLPSPDGDSYYALALSGPKEGWLAGSSGAMLALNNGAMTPAATHTRHVIYGLAVNAQGQGWAVGSEGLILRLHEGFWLHEPSPDWNDLFGVAFTPNGDAWAVGDGGALLYYTGSSWVRGPDVNAPALRAIAFNSQGEGWAVGSRGVILRFLKGQWAPSSSPAPTTQTLYSVAFHHDQEVWAVGESGVLLRCLS